MTLRFFRLTAAILAMAGVGAFGEEAGVYADVELEGGGQFTFRLETEKAPRAAGAFVGLATGEMAWMDWDGRVMRGVKYYDGRLVHRVLPGIAVQAGAVEGPAVTYMATNHGNALGMRMEGTIVTTNPPGISTNEFEALEIPSTLGAAAETEVEWQGRRWRSVASNWTRETVQLRYTTPGAGGGTTNARTLRDEWRGNGRMEEVESPYTVKPWWTVTNTNATPQVCTSRVWLICTCTNQLRLPVATGGTNFMQPGFAMPDAVGNGLKHVRGAVAMARSLPNTDGGQFFVCATNVAGWDGQYTVFGIVTEGMDTIDQLASAEVDTNNNHRPLADLRIRRVGIRRVGAAAETWDWRAQGVPEIGGAPARGLGSGVVEVEIPARSEMKWRSAAGLEEGDWICEELGYWPTGGIWRVAAGGGDAGFFHAAGVREAEERAPLPTDIRGQTLWLMWDEPVSVERVWFAEEPNQGGAWVRQTGTNAPTGGSVFIGYTAWAALAHSAMLEFWDNLYRRSLELRWDPGATNGTFRGDFTPHRGEGGGRVTGRFWFGDL